MLLGGLLPLTALALVVGIFCRRTRSISESIVLGALTWSFAIALATEVLSFCHAITLEFFLACWALSVGALILAILWPRREGRGTREGRSPPIATISDSSQGYRIRLLHRIRRAALGAPSLAWLMTAALVLIGGVTLLIALYSPPNSGDSQSYHLARIEHWIQNRSLEFYLTSNTRQLMLPPFAEVLILHFRLLSGGDRFDNLVQWLAGVGAVIVVGRIALALGTSRGGTALARLTAASLPIGILESSSTQNDLVVTFFLLCTAERLLAWRSSRSLRDAAFMAMAAGLALATKGTAYPIGIPLGIWFLVELLAARRRVLGSLLVCTLLVLLPNLTFYQRNLDYSGSPIGTLGQWTNNASFGLGPLVVNGARNLAVNLASADRALNRRITVFVYTGLTALGLDTNSPDLSFPPPPYIFQLMANQTNESSAGNPVQLVIGVVSVLVVFFSAGKKPYPRRSYALCVVVATLAFLIVLRWQPWITRLQLPIFALCAPLAGCLPIDRQRGRLAGMLTTASVGVVAILLVYAAWPALWSNLLRPLVPPGGLADSIWAKSREEALFTARPELLSPYRAAMDYAVQHNHSQIGLVMGGDDWEYPLWRGLRAKGIAPLRVEHVGLSDTGLPRPYPLGPFSPTLMFATAGDRPPEMTIDGHVWYRKLQFQPLAVYARTP